MTDTTVAIIGAGLAGLNAARLLHKAGVDFQLFEARSRAGGRILTVDEKGAETEDGFDLGPSWFWPQMQPVIGDLIEELGLQFFCQHSAGDVVFERMSREGPHRMPGLGQEPKSLRLAGGTAALVRALMRDLPADRLHFGTPVTALRLMPDGVQITAAARTVTARHVIAALPPRLFAERVALSPAPAVQDLARWKATATWMAPHAKVFALYDRPFWREAGFCGTAQSMVGPLAEIHDATTASGKAALFGFAGVPAANRAALGDDALIRAAIQQFVRLFGPEAATPRATLVKDWAQDAWTATPADTTPTGHPPAFAGDWVTGEWGGRLIMAGSEASPSEPGFLAGAVVASQLAVESVIAGRPDGQAEREGGSDRDP
jgi:monoamine oxidase